MIIFPLRASRDLQFLCHILTMAVVSASCSTSTTTWGRKADFLLGGSVTGTLLLSISLIFPHFCEPSQRK